MERQKERVGAGSAMHVGKTTKMNTMEWVEKRAMFR